MIHEAFHVARTGRPGPVVVDIPTDLSKADIPYEPVTDVHLPGYQPTTEGNAKQIRLAAKALADARRPVIYAGGGVILAEALGRADRARDLDRFPVTCTLIGLGGFPAPHEQWLGMLGMHGTARRELRDGRGGPDRARSAPASTTASPASCRSSRRGRSSSTSTSTRPRSPRTCRRTSRSSATRRTSWPS